MTTSFSEAIALKAVNATTFSALFQPDWSIGTLAHGGYVASYFLATAQLYFSTIQAAYDQHHAITSQLTFLRPTSFGSATFTVTDLKLGRRTSTILIKLTQGSEADSPPSVIAIITHSNIRAEQGVSLHVSWSLNPPSVPLPDFQALKKGRDANWTRYRSQDRTRRKAVEHVETYLPRDLDLGTGLVDQWIRMINGERFIQETLGFVADTFPLLMEMSADSQLDAEISRLGLADTAIANFKDVEETTSLPNPSGEGNETPPTWESKGVRRSHWGRFWYPTVSMNLDIKKALPEEGVEWLFCRVQSKQVRNGRMDIEIIVMDHPHGELVMLSHHVALVVGVERNSNRRDPHQHHRVEEKKKPEGSKL